ncbi:hypothetical protein Acj9p018 [Acinetobacter phage Acj9]|uniref:Uncharacterized protein n=1 Tax=Acinetobacter phage Acj9 TaxID=760939 RepID=E5EPF2_9CAUD|nr:hypothetical protein Acj9p018 [Acinetobacter phage Acj9]ADG59918.1 hypothetical protein Acj9p018 [Acinetobacter phage Acj9]
MGFEKKIYALVDPVGLKTELFCAGLADYIMKTGHSLRPMQVDSFGNVLSAKFGDGTMSVEHIPAHCIKYFEEVDPLAVGAIVIPTRPLRKDRVTAPNNVISFKKPGPIVAMTIEPRVVGSYAGAAA